LLPSIHIETAAQNAAPDEQWPSKGCTLLLPQKKTRSRHAPSP